MDGWMDATGSLPCLSLIYFLLCLETNPTSVGLRLRSSTQSQALIPMCSPASNNKHGMSAKMRVPHVGDHWLNQITMKPFSWSKMNPTRLRDVTNLSQSISVVAHWKNPVLPMSKKFNLAAQHYIDPHICRASFLSDKPRYPVTAQPGGSLLDFSWETQGCEVNLCWSVWWIWLSMCSSQRFLYLSASLCCSGAIESHFVIWRYYFTLKLMHSVWSVNGRIWTLVEDQT